MPRSRERLTYRLRRLPYHLAQDEVAEFLRKVSADFGNQKNITVFSLASNLVTWEKPPTKIATLMFRTTPKRFDNDEGEWTVSARTAGWNRDLIFDVHFHGFTPLNDVDTSMHLTDCIAISGFASHPFGSWMQRGSETSFMWLRDKLPEDVSTFRQIIYGYDTSLTGNESFQVIDDLAISFIAKLRSIGQASGTAKPLIYFAHSLGGIILKHALVTLAGSCGVERMMLEKTRSIFFFGVPHLGMEMSHLLSIAQGQPSEPLVRALSHEDVSLASLDDQFHGIAMFSKVEVISVYETKLSRAAQISAEGSVARTGGLHVAVNRLSAVHRDSKAQIPINKDHSNLVKFSPNDPDYDIIVFHLHEIATSFSPLDQIPSADFDHGTASESIEAALGQQIPEAGFTDSETFVDESNVDEMEKRLKDLKKTQKRDIDLRDEIRSSSGDRSNIEALGKTISRQGELIVLLEENVKKIKRKMELRRSLIQSLYIPALDQRFEKIENACSRTFDWIFEDTDLNFAHWLRNESGIYWIRGKPGSGKSTLMKYLSNHPRTSYRWKPDRVQIDIWFFFDDRGSYIQKSLEGLLHAVLHRITSSDKRLADIILPMYADKHPSRRDTWPISDLQQALMLLINQQELGLDLHLFLDALDEYGDPPEVIADFVADMSDRPTSCTRIKICFSSRPWNVFLDRFGQCPGFSIHEHTESDIRCFTRSIFVQNGLMTSSQTSSKSEDAVSLLSEIVRRAEGVFLWTKLVCTDVIRAYHERASFAELRELVLSFPQELEDYYVRIIDRLPQSRRFEAFVMLEVVARYKGTLSAEDFTGAIRGASKNTSRECIFNVTLQPSWFTMSEKTTRQLRDYTGGLLEVVVTSQGPIVQFMHQTVKHFLSTPGFMRRLLGSEASELRENGHSFLAKYYIAKAIATKGMPGTDTAKCALLGMRHAHLSETTTGVSQRIFLDSLEDESVVQCFQRFMHVNSRMSLAVVSDLRLYIRERLEELNTVNENRSLSLLYCLTNFTAMRSIQEMSSWSTSGDIWRESCEPKAIVGKPCDVPWATLEHVDLTEMCQILLGFGASLTKLTESLTPFDALFVPRLVLEQEGWPSSSQSRAITSVLLRHGQDKNAVLNFGKCTRGQLKNWNCQALHVSDAEMSKLLLEHGADVNALDDGGRTPLDIALSPNLVSFAFDGDPQKVCDRISVLLDYGACITKNGMYWRECMDWLQYNGMKDVLARLQKVSRLTLPLKRQSTLPGQPKLGSSRLSSALESKGRRSTSYGLSREATKSPSERLSLRPRPTATTNTNPGWGRGNNTLRQSSSHRTERVDEKARLGDHYTNSDTNPQTPFAGRTPRSTHHARPPHPAPHTRS